MAVQARRDEFSARIAAVLEEFSDLVDFEMPMLSDWVVVACYEEVGDAKKGSWVLHWPQGQWAHRTVGLLTMAAEDIREDPD